MSTDVRYLADWLASEEYLALAPNLYYWGRRIRCLISTVRLGERPLSELDATRRWLAEHDGRDREARRGRLSRAVGPRRAAAGTSDPTLLVITFRLAALGSHRLLHAAFRCECVLHTQLFAGFPGFRSKLWLDDVETCVYCRVYQWEGGELAALCRAHGGAAGAVL
jgi:hypothetical protein